MTDAVIEAFGLAHLVEQPPLGAIVERNVFEKVLKSSPTRASRHMSPPKRRRSTAPHAVLRPKSERAVDADGVEIGVQRP